MLRGGSRLRQAPDHATGTGATGHAAVRTGDARGGRSDGEAADTTSVSFRFILEYSAANPRAASEGR
jgi:hypothetical protein